MIRSAYLRVYDPQDIVTVAVDSLPVSNMAHNRIHLNEYGLIDESLAEDVLLADWNGDRYLCPRRPRLRVLEGVLAFHNAFAGGDVLVPETVAASAAAELEMLRDREPEQLSHILTSPWHVPLRWFVAFMPDDREVIETGDTMTIRYRTTRRQSSERLDEALEILEAVGMDDGVVDNVRELSEWLGKFPGQSMVELDYGSVAGMFRPADLVFDESASEVWDSIRALKEQDFERSARMYNDVSGRWSHAVAVTYLN